MKKYIYTLCSLAFILGGSSLLHAHMLSENYGITTSVLSSGGASMSSDNYQTYPTLGQPSPLMDPSVPPPYSTNYDLYPGFWYTLNAELAPCDDLSSFAAAYGSVMGELHYSISCDLDGDGDVDGSDLAGF